MSHRMNTQKTQAKTRMAVGVNTRIIYYLNMYIAVFGFRVMVLNSLTIVVNVLLLQVQVSLAAILISYLQSEFHLPTNVG